MSYEISDSCVRQSGICHEGSVCGKVAFFKREAAAKTAGCCHKRKEKTIQIQCFPGWSCQAGEFGQ
ncbi:hypothetical protein [Chitinophaga lutea]|uniref:hypothetical protein n=1 Tax=Chitinophaga lutea TaxID=2488634 RepID=UPI000F4DE98F|nr:hypothetical protein [Chitinophaga lutea]